MTHRYMNRQTDKQADRQTQRAGEKESNIAYWPCFCFPQYKTWLSLIRKQRVVTTIGTPKKGSPKIPVQSYGKLVLCKRFCQRVSEIGDDLVELRLLYAQAVHYVIHVSMASSRSVWLQAVTVSSAMKQHCSCIENFVCRVPIWRFQWSKCRSGD